MKMEIVAKRAGDESDGICQSFGRYALPVRSHGLLIDTRLATGPSRHGARRLFSAVLLSGQRQRPRNASRPEPSQELRREH